MDFQTRNGILLTGFWSAQSMHSTGTWTQTSFDTSHVQGPGLNSKRWSHLHHWHIRNWQGITMDTVLELMSTWEVISIRTLLFLLFKLTLTTTIIKSMIGSYVTLLCQELEWLWHFGLVTFYYLIHRDRTLFLLTVNQETKYFAFLPTLKQGLLVSMIIVTPLYNPATSSDFDLKHPLRLGWRNLSKTAEKRFLQPTCSGGCTWQWTCDVLLCQFFSWGGKLFLVLLTNLQYNHIGIGIQREGTTDRWLFSILIPTFKMYIFCIPDGQTNRQTDGEIITVWAG